MLYLSSRKAVAQVKSSKLESHQSQRSDNMEKCFVQQGRIFLPDPDMFRQEHKTTASCKGEKIPLLVQIKNYITKLKDSFTNLSHIVRNLTQRKKKVWSRLTVSGL